MTFDKYTIKAQEAVQAAVQAAQQGRQQSVEPVHLLVGIVDKGKDIVNFVFQKLGVNAQSNRSCNTCRKWTAVSLISVMKQPECSVRPRRFRGNGAMNSFPSSHCCWP